MHRTSLADSLVFLSAAMISISLLSGWRAADPPELPAPVQWMGQQSGITKARTVLVSDEATWERVFTEHMGKNLEHAPTSQPYIPEVDFRRYAVVCVFGGPMVNTSGIRMVSMTDLPDHHRLRYDAIKYQSEGPDGNAAGALPTPFGIFVIPRPVRTLVLEEDVNNLIGAPPVWTERERIEPPKQRP